MQNNYGFGKTVAHDFATAVTRVTEELGKQGFGVLTDIDVAATLKKAADPKQGKNVYATMSFVRDWTIVDDATITLNFTGPAPERQITKLVDDQQPRTEDAAVEILE